VQDSVGSQAYAIGFFIRLEVDIGRTAFDGIEQDFVAYPDMEEGIGTVVLLQAMDKSLQTGLPVKTTDILSEFNLQP